MSNSNPTSNVKNINVTSEPNPSIVERGGYVCKVSTSPKDKTLQYTRIGKNIKIVSIEETLENQEIVYKIAFQGVSNNTVNRSLSRSDIGDPKKLKELSGVGADIFNYNFNDMEKHLVNEEHRAKSLQAIKRVHKGVGWDTVDEGDEKKRIFKGYKAVGIESDYTGALNIEPKGSLDAWMDIVKKEVIGNTSLELAIAIGASAVVVGYLSDKYSQQSLFTHIIGDSSKGKTTAAQLAVSVAGSPNLTENSLMNTWNGTQNAITSILSGNYGLPIVLDELSIVKIKDLTKVIYEIVMGREKARLDKESNLKDVKSWRTTILSTGETKMSEEGNMNTGQKVRIIELVNLSWTKSAKNADAIKQGVFENYGHVSPLVAEYLINSSDSDLDKRFNEIKDKCIASLDKDDEFSSRVATNFAMLILTGEILNECLDLNLDLDKMLALLVKNEKSSSNKKMEDLALETLNQIVSIHSKNFVLIGDKYKDQIKGTICDTWGQIRHTDDSKGKKIEISIVADQFEKLMREKGYKNSKLILNKWKEKGLLRFEEDRLSRRIKVGNSGAGVPVYTIVQDAGESYYDPVKEQSVKEAEAAGLISIKASN